MESITSNLKHILGCEPNKSLVLKKLKFIIEDTDLPIHEVLKKYEITLVDANTAVGGLLLEVVHKCRKRKEFTKVIKVYKDYTNGLIRDIYKANDYYITKRVYKTCAFEKDEIYDIMQGAAKNGNWPVLKLLLDRETFNRKDLFGKNVNLLNAAAVNGHVRVLEKLHSWFVLRKEDVLYVKTGIFNGVAHEGHFHVLKWLFTDMKITKEDKIDKDNEIMYYAAKSGHLSTLKLIITHLDKTRKDVVHYNNKIFRWAANGGHLHVLKWLTEKYEITREEAILSDNSAFRRAAERGYLDVIKWLTERFDLTVDEILLHNKYAIVWAIANGHLSVLQWMTEKFNLTKEHFTFDGNKAIRWAITGGRLPVIKWLVEQFGFDILDFPGLADVIAAARELNREEVVDWFAERRDQKLKFVLVSDLDPNQKQNQKQEQDQIVAKLAQMEKNNESFITAILQTNGIITDQIKRCIIDYIIEHSVFYPKNKLREAICGLYEENEYLYYDVDDDRLNKLIDIYELPGKPINEILSIIVKICHPYVVGYVFDCLIKNKIVPLKNSEQPKLTIEQVRKQFPEYIIARPEELSNHFANKM